MTGISWEEGNSYRGTDLLHRNQHNICYHHREASELINFDIFPGFAWNVHSPSDSFCLSLRISPKIIAQTQLNLQFFKIF